MSQVTSRNFWTSGLFCFLLLPQELWHSLDPFSVTASSSLSSVKSNYHVHWHQGRLFLRSPVRASWQEPPPLRSTSKLPSRLPSLFTWSSPGSPRACNTHLAAFAFGGNRERFACWRMSACNCFLILEAQDLWSILTRHLPVNRLFSNLEGYWVWKKQDVPQRPVASFWIKPYAERSTWHLCVTVSLQIGLNGNKLRRGPMQSTGYNYFPSKQSPWLLFRSAAGFIALLYPPPTPRGQRVLRCLLADLEGLTPAARASLASAHTGRHQTSRARYSLSFGFPQLLLFRWPKGGHQFPRREQTIPSYVLPKSHPSFCRTTVISPFPISCLLG